MFIEREHSRLSHIRCPRRCATNSRLNTSKNTSWASCKNNHGTSRWLENSPSACNDTSTALMCALMAASNRCRPKSHLYDSRRRLTNLLCWLASRPSNLIYRLHKPSKCHSRRRHTSTSRATKDSILLPLRLRLPSELQRSERPPPAQSMLRLSVSPSKCRMCKRNHRVRAPFHPEPKRKQLNRHTLAKCPLA